jgi:hypothetical protein
VSDDQPSMVVPGADGAGSSDEVGGLALPIERRMRGFSGWRAWTFGDGFVI